MNNFTKSDSESFWHAITNLTCCSIASRKSQLGIRAFMVVLLFAFSIGSMYAQKIDLPQQRSTFYPVCIDERPVGFSEEEIATLYQSMCPDGTTAQVVKSETLSGDDCSWTTVYTYVVTCGDFEDELKVTYEGGDTTAPEITGDAPGGESGLNLCYEDIPLGPTANEIAAIYSDDCGNVNVVKSGSPEGTDCNWSVTYTYTIVDDCGNAAPDFQITYSGGDTEAPVLAKGAVLPEGETGLNVCYNDRPTGPTAEEVAALFVDNCGNVNVDKAEYFKGDDCGWKGEVIYTIYDDCGNNTENLTLYYNGGDNEAPEFIEVPGDITVSCIDEVPGKMGLPYTDNCATGEDGKPLYTMNEDDLSGLGIACEGGVVIRTWTAVDDCGHSTSVSQTITVLPAPKAEFDEPQDYTIDCGDLATFQPQSLYYTNNVDGGACEISGYAEGVAEDFTGSCGSFTVNYSFTDECGYTITASQTVTVEDNEAPIIEEGKNAHVECDGSGNVEEYNAWLAINGEATATDNCGSITWTYEEILEENCGGMFLYYVDFTATDECGNSSTWKGIFHVDDTTAPEVTDAQDMTVECDGQGNMDDLNAWLNSNGGATASDVCSDISWSNNFDSLSDDCGATGSATVEFTVTDSCGNSSKTTATFTIEDTTAPSLVDAQDMTVECDGQGNIDDLNAWLNSNGGASASDVCSDIVWSNNFDMLSDGCGMTGSATVEFTATDDCGNSSKTTATFTIEDTNSPPITMSAQDMTVECDGQGNMSEYQAWLDNNGGATAVDICSDITWSYQVMGETDDCGMTKTITVLFTVTDDCGLSSSTEADFIIEDTTSPEITDAQDVTVECKASTDNRSAEITIEAWLDNNGGATASDLCGDVTWTNNFNGLSDDCGNTGSATVEFTATDSCGNTSKTTATYTIVDTTAPSIEVSASDMTVECDGSGNQEDLMMWLDNNGGASAYDICGDVTWSHNFDMLSDDCGATGYVTVEFTATDDCGNSSKTTATFTIEDTTAPDVTDAQDMTVECDGQGNMSELDAWLANNGGATATDICGDVTWSNNFDMLSDDCGATGSATVEFTATDACGNTSKTTATFTIEDTTAPGITDAQDITVECDGQGNYYDLESWLLSNGGATASDACSDVVWSHNFDMLSDDCGATGSATVEFTATDDCGNSSKTTATFTIVDTTAPGFEVAPQDMTVECDGQGNTEDLNAWLASNGGGYAYDICSDITWSNNFDMLSDDCGATGSATVEFTVTDDCGNETKATATFTIEDTTNPSIDYHAKTEIVECDGQGNIAELNAWLDSNGGAMASDYCGDVTWSNDFNSLSDDCGMTGSVTVVFTVADECGNTSKTQADFIIEDTTAPELTDAQDMTVECDGQGNSEELSNWLLSNGGATASDICGDVTWSNNFDALSDDCGMTGSATVEFTATDACGNTSKTTATFTIEDTTAPGIGIDAKPETVECDGQGNLAELNAWLDNNGGATASDICGDVTWSNNFDMLSDDCGATGTVSVIFTATDACGNTNTTESTFTIEDTTAPEITDAQDETVECSDGNLGGGDCIYSIELYDSFGDGWNGNSINVAVDGVEVLSSITLDDGYGPVSFDIPVSHNDAIITVYQNDGDWSYENTYSLFDTEGTQVATGDDDNDIEYQAYCPQPSSQELYEAWLANNGGATASDLCGDVTWTNNATGLSDECGMTGSETVEFTATDACGNTSKTTATFTVVDTSAPVITAQAEDMTVECSASPESCSYSVVLSDSFGDGWNDNALNIYVDGVLVLENVTLDDGYEGDSMAFEVTNGGTIFAEFVNCPAGDYTCWAGETSYTIYDSNGNEVAMAEDGASIDGLVAECMTSDDLFAAWLANNAGAMANDYCGDVTWSNNSQGLSDDCGATGTETVTFTVTDECGNTSTSTATFTVIDTTAPTIDMDAEDMLVECDGAGNMDELNAWLANNGGASASDTCSDVTWTNNFNGLSDDCGMTGSATVVFTATDECGNATTTEATFTIEDTVAPNMDEEAKPEIVECDGQGNQAELAAWLADNGGAKASDVCSDVTWSHSNVEFSDDCGLTGSATVVFTATDDCGNYVTTEATFTIEDTTAPDVVDAQDMSVECDGQGNIADLQAWVANNGGATASDDCGEVTWTNDFNNLSDDCGMTGSATVTFTATDDCGNAATTTATFTIVDTTAPNIDEEAMDMTVECDGQGNMDELNAWLADNGGAKASDICSDFTWSNNFNGLSDDCGETGSATVEFTVTDECGNESKSTATFTIIDTTNPTIDYEAMDMTVECDGNGNVDELNAWLADNAGAMASDTCSGVTWSNNFDMLSDDCAATGSVTVEFTATDDCGNIAKTTATFTIEDTTAPVLVGQVPQGESNVDACFDMIPQGPTEAEIAALFYEACGEVVVEKTGKPLGDDCSWAVMYSYAVSDECGNPFGDVKVWYNGGDISAPTFNEDLPADMTVECDAVPSAAVLTATDNCADVVVEFNEQITEGNCKGEYTIVNTWSVADNCGNATSHTQTITVVDTMAPVLIGELPTGENQINACLSGAPEGPTEEEIAALFSDACGDVVVVKETQTWGDDCSWIVNHEYTVSDDCGNMYDGLIKVYYQGSDQNAPEFDIACQFDAYEIEYDCPADATISLSVGDEIDPYMGWTVAGQQIDPIGSCVSDDCTLTKDIILRVMDVTYGGDSCETDISVSFEAEDACGNISEDWFTCTYVIKDLTAPVVECPADQDFGIDPAMDASGLPVGLADKAPYTDNCQGDGMTIDYTDSAITSVEEVIAPTEDFKFIFFNGGYEVNFGQPAGFDAGGYPYYVGDSYYSNDGSPYNAGVLELVYNANAGEYEMLQDGNVIGNGPEYLGYPDCNGTWNVEGNTHDKAHYLECGNPQSVTTYTMTRTFIATDACGNTGECSVTYTWSVSTATPVCGYQVVECGDSVIGNTADGGVEDVIHPDNGLTGNWYTFMGTGQNMVVLSTCNATDYDSRINVYTDCGDTFLAGNDDAIGCGLSSEVGFYAEVGVEYSIFVTGWLPGSVGNYELSVMCDVTPPPPAAPEAPSNKVTEEDVKLDFKAYPVPFDKEVTIGYNFDFETNVTIEVYDTKGLLVMSETNNAYRAGSDASAKLDLSNGGDQLFYVTVTTSQGSVTKKIVSSTLRRR